MNAQRLAAFVPTLVLSAGLAMAAPGPEDAPVASVSGGHRAVVGTWLVSVDASAGGFPPFQALHTYHADGTFTEVSDLLGQLNETPAHGVWNFRRHKHNLTFELFTFDANRAPAGRARVRCALQVKQGDLLGDCTVDFIDVTGAEFVDIDTATFTGKRVKVIPR
jgi:hypothetical protein